MVEIKPLPEPAGKIMAGFMAKILKIEPPFVDGVYITGSLALNDFHRNKSDVDFIVICKTLPDKSVSNRLERIHAAISKQFDKPDLNGCYIASDCISTDRPTQISALSYHAGKLRYGHFEMAPVTLWELKYHAITLFGEKAENLHIGMIRADLHAFLHENINGYWKKWLHQHAAWFRKRLLLLLFPRFTEWSILGVARQIYTLHTGRIASKTEAGLYCLDRLPLKFQSVVKQALEIRKDHRRYPIVKSYAIRPSFQRLKQTLDCLHYMISVFNQAYKVQENKSASQS